MFSMNNTERGGGGEMEEILLIWEAAVLYTGLSLIPIFLHNYTERFSPVSNLPWQSFI